MTFYIILQWKTSSVQADSKFEWYQISDPEHYINAKAKMQKLKKDNPLIKYKLIKTSY